MRNLVIALTIAGGLSLTAFPARAATVNATCKDGTTYAGTSKRAACKGHGGVDAFASPSAVAATPSPAGVAPATAALPGDSPQMSPGGKSPTVTSSGSAGPGQVWVNTKSHVYHCQGDRDYGHTKAGSYMTEAEAKAAGARPSRGKVCS